MAATQLDVKYVAHLARLQLSSDEEKKLSAQLGHILGYIEKLNELDVTGVEPTAHAVPMVNVTRPDEIQPSLPHDEALFMVPKIVE
jgi:aspartyl-tRNA(Asn)/glutamyl-tRNA(Gln) amidotransferase subunit C